MIRANAQIVRVCVCVCVCMLLYQARMKVCAMQCARMKVRATLMHHAQAQLFFRTPYRSRSLYVARMLQEQQQQQSCR